MKKIICLLLALIMVVSSVSLVSASDSEGKYVYRNNTYDFKIMSDPMDITDEDFFGVWDSESETWTTESCFKYEEFPAMSKVEAAAKAGNYEEAKEELLNYYILQKDTIYNTSVSSITDADRMQAEMQARNFYAATTTGTPLEIVSCNGTEWQTISSKDILSHIKKAVSSGNPYVAFTIASIDKSNTPLEIKSKDTDSPARLNLVVNKVAMSFPVYEDAYISPTLNANTNYGSEEILYAQEYGYVGNWTDVDYPWGGEAAETKRTYIKFDISSLSATADISSAELNFTARVAEGGDLTSKEILVYGWEDASWREGSLTWNSFSDWLFFSCNDQEAWSFVTHALSTIKGKLCYYHRGTLTKSLASMYNFTKDEQYAYTFLRQMMSLINHVGANKYEEHHFFDDPNNPPPHRVMSHLDMQGYVTQLRLSLFYVIECQTLKDDPGIFTALVKQFINTTNYMCKYQIEPQVNVGNMASANARSAYYACKAFPEIKYADYWYEMTLQENSRIHQSFVYEDGSSFAQGFGYIWTELGGTATMWNTFLETKTDYYGTPFSESSINILYGMVKNALYSTAPGVGGFNFGDSIDHGKTYKSDFRGWYNNLLKMGVDESKLQDLLYLTTGGKQGVLPEFTSISFPDARRTYMRTDWTKDAIALAFTAKGDNASHRHNDALSVVLFAYGKNLLVDSSYASILTGDDYAYMKAAHSHNTITVNGMNIVGSTGQDSVEKEMELNNLYDFATYSYGYVQDAKNVERSVLFLKNQKFFIVSDYVVPDNSTKENTYTQFWHMLPDSGIYISDKNEFRSNFDTGANVIVSPVDTEGMSGISLEDSLYCPSIGSYIDNKKGVYERKSNGNVKYGTVLYPLESGDDRKIETDVIDVAISDAEAQAFRIRITDPETLVTDTYYFYHLSDLSQKQEVTLGKYKTDATTMLVHEDMSGKVKGFFVYDGTYIESSSIQDKYLFKSSNGEKTLGVNFTSITYAEIASKDMKKSDLADITVYAGFNVSASTFNSERIIETKKDGAYIYYGDTPIVNCTETAPPNSGTNNDSSFGDFVGGGGLGGGGGITTDPSKEDENKEDESTKPVDKPVITTPSYDDVSKNDWYYDYVTELTEKQIVSGDGTGNFAPNNNVTREQFLKMLMIAANVDTEEAENTFDDVEDSAWYKPYVLMARGFGIVNGVSDTEFGIGSNITRQDMAVMIARIIEKLGINVQKSETDDFADDNKISEYAKESVMMMKSIGLIEGYNNQYRPLDTLTRAESAKVISCLLELLKAE